VSTHRAELGEFLKARRARVSPEDVGLPAGGRRRTPRPRHVVHPTAGELHFTVTEFAVPAHPDLILFIETPADEETRSRLPLTRRSLVPAEA